jgi:hypothetical protein
MCLVPLTEAVDWCVGLDRKTKQAQRRRRRRMRWRVGNVTIDWFVSSPTNGLMSMSNQTGARFMLRVRLTLGVLGFDSC